MPRWAVFALSFWVGGCLWPWPFREQSHGALPPEDPPSLPSGPFLEVVVLGDWGTGGPGQREVARGIEAAFTRQPPALVLTVGDNFYPAGVLSSDDPAWERVFRRVYSGPFWDTVPFRPTLGNHDHDGDPDAQVRYASRDSRWAMPARFYAFRQALPGGSDSVLFVALDTSPLEGGRQGSRSQPVWLDSILQGGRRDRWVVVYGHHPLASVGWHSPSAKLRELLLPLLDGRVDLYLAGHNHSLELLPVSPRLLQGVCGGGGGTDNPYRVKPGRGELAAFTHGGWCTLRIGTEHLAVELFDRTGRLRYRHILSAGVARTRQAPPSGGDHGGSPPPNRAIPPDPPLSPGRYPTSGSRPRP